MRIPRIWGTDLEIRAAAILWDIRIDSYVYSLDPSDTTEPNSRLSYDFSRFVFREPIASKNKGTLCLALLNGNHFNIIRNLTKGWYGEAYNSVLTEDQERITQALNDKHHRVHRDVSKFITGIDVAGTVDGEMMIKYTNQDQE